jgi:glycosyltransferase involved in cell wall biosynthesis
MQPPTPQPVVSVVIPARNAAPTLDQQLDALRCQDFDQPWELIVVDNGSTDATSDIVRRWTDRLPSLRIRDCPAPGVNRARNAGIHESRAERVLLCDADDVVSPGWIRSMYSALDTWDLVGGPTETTWLNDEVAQRSRLNPVAEKLPIAFGFLPYAVGASMGFRREVFDAIGGFDEDFPLGSDEIDFCWRAQYAQFRLGFADGAVVHYRLRSSAWHLIRQSYNFARGDSQLWAKHAALGHVTLPTGRRQLHLARTRLRSLARPYRLAQPEHRLAYARSLGRALGSAAGFARHHIII